MKITSQPTSLRTIRPGDNDWYLVDGSMIAARASIEISDECPFTYKSIILQAIESGWLKSVATVKDTELFWEEFSK